MARDISSRALECISSGPNYRTKVTVTLPGGDPVELETAEGWSVQRSWVVAGTRATISGITFLPTVGVDDLFGLVSWPGALFDAFIGINLGSTVEYIPVFQGFAVTDSSRRNRLGVTTSLSDGWAYYDGVKLGKPFKTTVGASRADQIAALFTAVNLGISVVVEDDGGDVARSTVYTDTRSQAASELAADGLLTVCFDGDGDLVIKAQPDVYHDLVPVWTFKSGNAGRFTDFGLFANDRPNIVAGSLERNRALSDSLYNSVVVSPAADWQTWKAQTAYLTDTSDPRHQNNIGLRQKVLKSNTIDNACDAYLLAKNELGRMARFSETARVEVPLNPAVEEGDVVFLAAGPTADDPGWAGSYIVTNLTHSPKDRTTSADVVSAGAWDMGLAA